MIYINGELKGVIYTTIVFLFLIWFISWNDKHYSQRIRIPIWLNKFFFNQVKNETVPLLAFVTFLQFYLTMIISIIFKVINNAIDLYSFLILYFAVPYIFISVPITVIADFLIGYMKRKVEKKLEREKRLEKNKNSIKKKSKKRKFM